MLIVTLFDRETGEFVATAQLAGLDEIAHHINERIGAVDGTWSPETHKVDLATGDVVERSLPIEQIRSRLWGDVKRLREKRISGGCMVAGLGIFDTDLVSRTNISGAVTAAMVAGNVDAPFSIEWKMADNSLITMDGNQMIAAGLAVMGHVNACHEHARALLALIDAAEDSASIQRIEIDAGWPT